MWRKMMVNGPAPPAFAASMNSRCLMRERLPAHDPRHGQPFEAPDADEQQYRRAAEDHHQDDDEQDVGQRVHDVDEAHHDRVDPAAEIAGDGAVDDADHHRDAGRDGGDEQRHLRALERPRQHVATVLVGAEIVALGPVRRLADPGPVDLVVGPGQEIRAEIGDQHHRHEHEDGDQRRLVADEAPHRVLGERAALRRALGQRVGVGGEGGVLAGDASHQRYLTLGSSQA